MTPPNGDGGASDSPLHFTGQPRDPETGLDYFGARYNDSTLGRFLTPDWSEDPEPVPYADLENPQSLNLYSYVQKTRSRPPTRSGISASATTPTMTAARQGAAPSP